MMMTNKNNGAMSRKALMNRISALGLATHETVLYLDTHPHCQEAMEYFTEMKRATEDAVCEYERRFGPLTVFSANTENGWDWIDSPWPWESDSTRNC